MSKIVTSKEAHGDVWLTSIDGLFVIGNGTQNFKGCRDSEFDQYGDVAAFGLYPEVSRA